MRGRSWTGGLAVCLLLAACGGGGGESGAGPTAGQSAAATSPRPSSPATLGANVRRGEKPPALSAVAKTHTKAGAQSFAIYFVQAVDWGITTIDPALIAAVSAPSCQACLGYVQSLTAMRAKGDSIRGARIHVVSAGLMTGTLPVKADYGVELVIREDAGVDESAGAAAPTTEGQPNQDYTRVYLNWTTDGWQVVEQTSR